MRLALYTEQGVAVAADIRLCNHRDTVVDDWPPSNVYDWMAEHGFSEWQQRVAHADHPAQAASSNYCAGSAWTGATRTGRDGRSGSIVEFDGMGAVLTDREYEANARVQGAQIEWRMTLEPEIIAQIALMVRTARIKVVRSPSTHKYSVDKSMQLRTTLFEDQAQSWRLQLEARTMNSGRAILKLSSAVLERARTAGIHDWTARSLASTGGAVLAQTMVNWLLTDGVRQSDWPKVMAALTTELDAALVAYAASSMTVTRKLPCIL